MDRNNVEAVYNLSPLQEGMQFHHLLSPDSKSYFQQLCCQFEGALNYGVFEEAWRTVIKRHDVLRTAFVWEGLDKLLQVVQREVEFGVDVYSFEECAESELQEKLREFLIADKSRGIEFSKAPLMRISLIKTAENKCFMVWSHHHILLDGWSLTILLKEIFAVYEAKIRGFDLQLPRSQPYRDYIKWINAQDTAEAKRYWEEKLREITHPSRLAVQKSAAVADDRKQEFVEIQKVLDADVTARIKLFGKENRLTLNTLTQGAWAYLLSRYSGEEKVIFGVTINGRPTELSNSENMVGLFINTLPICVEVRPPLRTREWLADIQKQQGELEQYSYSSLTDIQGWSRIPRGTPLFETILVFENFPLTDTAESANLGITIENAYLNEQTNYPVTAVAVPGEEMTLLLSYNTAQFDPETAGRLLENWSSALLSIALEAPENLSGVKIFSKAEEAQLREFQAATQPLPESENYLHKIFEKQAAATPANVAVVTETEEISFEQLNRYANRLAHFLIEQGVSREQRVGICLRRRWQMIGAMLAVLKSGGVYVPLSPETPRERLEFMIGDSNLSAVITENDFSGSLPSANLPVFIVERDEPELAGKSAENPRVEMLPGNEAYIIYTSGSTGNPKGVVAVHQGIANFTLDIVRKLGLNENHRMLQFAPLSFDASAIQIYPPLLAGGGVVLNRKVTELSNLEILEYCIEKKVSVIDFPSGYWHQWLDEIDARGLRLDARIQIFLTGGDRLSGEKLKQWARLTDANALFLSSYGPTETTVSATVFITTRDEILHNDIGSSQIGKPLANVQIYVIDPRWFQQTPLGVDGELYIAGYGLARNYLNAADLTAEKFVPNPFAGADGSRMYKTGDAVKHLPGGVLEFLGRNDQQVKIRGLRVEIGEIERELKKHEDIQEAVVLAVDDGNGEKKLAGFIKTVKDSEIMLSSLRNRLKNYLPEYMIPTAFYAVSQFPLLSSGKVDRQQLLAENHPKLGGFEDFSPARSPIEQTVAEVWQDVLKQQNIGINQNFFELGGHSLIATQLISRIRNIFQLEIPLQSLFQNTTVAEFSSFLQNELAKNQASPLPALGQAVRPAKIPLSFSQERLFFIDRMLGENSIFNLTGILKIEGKIDLAVLERSVNAVIDRHEVLRTSFIEENGQPLQLIHPEKSIELESVDLRGVAGGDVERVIKKNVSREINTPFDLANEALLRARLLNFGDDLQFLLITIHHIVCDGWSMGILAREIAEHYRSLKKGNPVELPKLPVQYADYALWQRNWLTDSAFNGELDYWTKQLENLPPFLEIPTDFDRPVVQTYAGAQEQIEFGAEMSDALRKLAQQQGVTLFMLLVGVYKLLLHRYLGQTDIFIGTPIAGRQQFETEGLIGFFLNTIVLRTDLSGNPPFSQLLKKVRENSLNAYSNQNIPFEKLIEVLKPERDRSRTPLVQTAFNMLNLAEEKIALEDLTITGILPDDQWSKFDLTIYAGERDRKIFLNLVYNTSLYGSQTIARVLRDYQKLCEEILIDPHARLDRFRIASSEELEEIYARNRRQGGVARDQHGAHYEFAPNIVAQFEKQAGRYPANTALFDEGQAISYERLDLASTGIADFLHENLQPDADRNGVGLLLGHNSLMIEAIVGSLKSGRSYVPLDSFHPAERLAEILLDAECECLLTESRYLQEAEQIKAIMLRQNPDKALRIFNLENAADFENTPAASTKPISPAQTAYILYTSGSTGKPKGIYQSHEHVLKHIRNYSKSLGIGAEDKVLLLASYSFDAAIMDIFGALMNGAELHLYDLRRNGFADLPDFVRKNEITIYHSTPTVFRALAGNLAGSGVFPNVRKVVLGGEEVFRTDVEIFNKFFNEKAVLINGLGPTESTLALQYFIPHGVQPKRRSVPVGFPVEDTKITLLDEAGNETGIFGTGEIAIESDRLALGYWKREDLTAQSFRDSEAGGGKRIYKTGDLGKRLPDYSLVFLGRKDFQIKIRGQRVEIGEIEAKLNHLPNVETSAVIVKTEAAREPLLAAFVVPAGNDAVSPFEIKKLLRKDLPDFMIPQAIQFIESIPMTATGKIDRQKLNRFEISTVETAENPDLPETSGQKTLLAIWKEILNLENLGINDDFFAVGGHSLIATQLITRVRQEFGANLELREIFEFTTVKLLAERIDEINAMPGGGALQVIPRRTVKTDLPLANAQKRLWFLNELEPGNPAYNMSIGFKVNGKLDLEALRRALNFLLARHESLRTVIVEMNGHPFQIVKEFEPVALNLADLSGEPSLDREAAAAELLREAVRKPFDLSAGPLIRHLVVKLSDERFLMMFCLHHIICDGWSIGVFTRELAHLYMSYISENDAEMPELPIQYADFAVWQDSEQNKAELNRQIDYWKRKLGNNPASLKLPYDRPLPHELTYRGEHKSFRIKREIIDELDRMCRRHGATMFMLMLSAWKVLFMRYANQDEIVVGIPVAGRALQGTEGLIGMFVNTLVLRTFLSSSMTFEEALAEVKKGCLEAYAHQDLPFETLVSALKPTRDLSRVPLFEVMFNWLNFYENPEEIARSTDILTKVGLRLEQMSVENNYTKFDISLILSEGENGLAGVVEYNTMLFDAATIERILANFETLLSSIIEYGDRRIGELPIVSAREAAQVAQYSQNPTEKIENQWLAHQYFEKQADENPSRTAVVFRNESLTYAELEEKANRLAHFLRARGIGIEQNVGVCVERSLEMVVAVLGIAKTGAAYVPLDPEYPVERLKYMMADANVELLLTTSEPARLFDEPGDFIVDLKRVGGEIANQPNARPASAAGLDNLFYVIYTSGSTGTPKGSMNVHRGVANRLAWMQHRYRFDESDRILQMSSFSFDFSNWEIFGTLGAGAALIIPEPDAQRDFDYVARLIREQNVTIAHFVPSQLRLFLESAEAEKCRSLKRIFCGGEELPVQLIEKCRSKLNADLSNQYGPTETSIDVTYWDCPPDFAEAAVPIGQPNANNRLYILDGGGAAVPIGGTGEIYIGGEAVGRGYVGKPSETAERFVPDPFSPRIGARMYKTGDLGKFNNRGLIEYRGRADHQVKLRGFRIELGEIEKLLLDSPDIEDAAATLYKPNETDEKLAAYVVPRKGVTTTINELRELLAGKLPHYMIPSTFVMMEKLPLSANGKLDRRALPAPEKSTLDLGGDFQKPVSEIEEKLGKVWAEVLGLEKVGVNDNFFALGGDSILSIQIVVKAREYGLNFNPRQLFKYQTIAELAPFTDYQQKTKAEQGRLEGKVPLAPIQIDFFEREISDPDNYSQAVLIDVGKEIEPEKMKRCVEFLIDHHDVLRSRFSKTADLYEQVILKDETADVFGVADLSLASADDKRTELVALVDRARKRISLETGPVFDARLVFLSENDGWRLLLTAHHLVVDGVSWRIIADHLAKLYQSEKNGEQLDLGEKTCSYRQWSAAVRSGFDHEKAAANAGFWLDNFGNSRIMWTADDPAGENTEEHAERINRRLNADETKILIQEIPKAFNSQIANLLLTAWLKAVNEWNGGDEILVAVEGHGRDEIEALDVTATAGWFTTVTPVLIGVSGEAGLLEQIGKSDEDIKTCLRNGLYFRQLRYFGAESQKEHLRKEWQPKISFNYLGQIRNAESENQSWKLAAESIGGATVSRNRRQYELDVNLLVVDGKLESSITFSRRRYRSANIERLLDLFDQNLKRFVHQKDEILQEIENEKNMELIGEIERDELDEILAEVEFEM